MEANVGVILRYNIILFPNPIFTLVLLVVVLASQNYLKHLWRAGLPYHSKLPGNGEKLLKLNGVIILYMSNRNYQG